MSSATHLKIAVLPLARPTFDVPFAEETCRNAWDLLEQLPAEWTGTRDLLLTPERLKQDSRKWLRILQICCWCCN